MPDADALWGNVEKRLDEKKKNRVWIWWLPLALLLGTGIGFLGFENLGQKEGSFGNQTDINSSPKELPVSNQISVEKSNVERQQQSPFQNQLKSGMVVTNSAADVSYHRSNLTEKRGRQEIQKSDLIAEQTENREPTKALSNSDPSQNEISNKARKKDGKSFISLSQIEPTKTEIIEIIGEQTQTTETKVESDLTTQKEPPTTIDVFRSLAGNDQSKPEPSKISFAGQDKEPGGFGPMSPSDGGDVYVRNIEPAINEMVPTKPISQAIDSSDADTLDSDSTSLATSIPALRLDSSGRVKPSSRFYFLTGPSVLQQEARFANTKKEVKIPTRLSVAYGWFAALGYQEALTSWLRVGAQAGVSFLNQTLEYTKTKSQVPVFEVAPVTGALNVQSTTRYKETANRWLITPSVDLLLDIHTTSSGLGVRLGGGILGWYGTGVEGSTSSPLLLRPQFRTQVYTRLKNWELNLGLQSFSVATNAIPVFETAKSQNWMVGVGIGKRW